MMSKDYPNVIFIMLDAVRAKNLSCYGYPKETTPIIDRFAQDAILYRNAISAAPWTSPSHASMFTGLYPSQHGVHGQNPHLRQQFLTLPEALQQHGYRTVAISNNPWITPTFGFDRGFDEFIYAWQLLPASTDLLKILERAGPHADASTRLRVTCRMLLQGNLVKNLINGIYAKYLWKLRDSAGAAHTNALVKRWIRRSHDPHSPFFIFVTYLEAHAKYRPPRAFRSLFLPEGIDAHAALQVPQDWFGYLIGQVEMSEQHFMILEALYNGELRYLDYRIGELLQFLEACNVLDNTILIITADHGENIGDFHLMGHAYCLYQTLLHVPLILRLPAGRYAGQEVAQLVQTSDIFRTILELLGLEGSEAAAGLERYSLIPDTARSHPRDFAIAEHLAPPPEIRVLRRRHPGFDSSKYDRSLRAVLADDGHKFIWASDGRHELYNLSDDPDENHNLIESHPQKAEELQATLDRLLPPIEAVLTSDEEPPQVDEAVRRRLKGLGYLSD